MYFILKFQKHHIVSILLLILIFTLSACGPKPGGEYSSKIAAYDINVEGNYKQMTVSWKKRGNGTISGYNIYIEETEIPQDIAQLNKLKPYNLEPFPGDTSPEDGIENYIADGLKNSIPYYVTVRVLFPDGSQSYPTNVLRIVCGPKGEMELAVRYAAKNDGYSFQENKYVSADGATNDLYYFVKKGVDMIGSPKRLSGFNRDSRFVIVKKGSSFEELADSIKGDSSEPELIEINKGDWIFVRDDDGGEALLKVLGFSGEGKARQIKLFFDYRGYVK